MVDAGAVRNNLSAEPRLRRPQTLQRNRRQTIQTAQNEKHNNTTERQEYSKWTIVRTEDKKQQTERQRTRDSSRNKVSQQSREYCVLDREHVLNSDELCREVHGDLIPIECAIQ